MKTDDYINELIEREKKSECNPYLATRIMAKIEAPKHKTHGVVQYMAVAGSIALVVMLGMVLGNSYTPVSEKHAGININDREMENFTLYNTDDNE